MKMFRSLLIPIMSFVTLVISLTILRIALQWTNATSLSLCVHYTCLFNVTFVFECGNCENMSDHADASKFDTKM